MTIMIVWEHFINQCLMFTNESMEKRTKAKEWKIDEKILDDTEKGLSRKHMSCIPLYLFILFYNERREILKLKYARINFPLENTSIALKLLIFTFYTSYTWKIFNWNPNNYKEEKFTIYKNMDRTWGNYAKRNMHTKKNTMLFHLHVEF